MSDDPALLLTPVFSRGGSSQSERGLSWQPGRRDFNWTTDNAESPAFAMGVFEINTYTLTHIFELYLIPTIVAFEAAFV